MSLKTRTFEGGLVRTRASLLRLSRYTSVYYKAVRRCSAPSTR
jgi:hypothetical protein